MSSLPPQLITSALQGTLQQRQVQHARSVSDRQQSDMGQAVVRTGEKHESQIEDATGDNALDAEGGSAGGAGGQGRAFAEHHQPDTDDSSQSQESGITSDDDGQAHLDITA